MIIQGSPEILRGPRGLNGFGDFGETASPAVALDLLYRSSTTGAPTAEFDKYGGYAAVKAAAEAAGYAATPVFIQSYEVANKLPESESTILNKQFIGAEGEARLAKIEADLNSQNAAVVAAATAKIQAEIAKANAQFAAEEAARKKVIADAYAAAQAASKAAADAKTLAAKQAADALRVRALVVVKALYLQVLGREGDQAGLDYFADRFGDVIDPDELQVFKDMSKPEIDARNKYLADMAAKSKDDAAKAKAIADQFAATAAKAKADAAAASTKDNPYMCAPGEMMVDGVCVGVGAPTKDNPYPYNPRSTTSTLSPMLILAAAAAAFFFAG